MAIASSAAALSANSCSTNMRIHFLNNNRYKKQERQNLSFFKIRASSDEQEDCNVEECAPDKEVGKVSVEWLAGEKTKVAGTFPPRRRDWSGYVEKDTAGQTNIYSVEPAVYVAESAISSGNSGTSADGSENTAALLAFGSIIAVAAAASIIFQVGKTATPIQTFDYSGPSLSYYITKFKPTQVVKVSATTEETQPSTQLESSPQLDSETQPAQPETPQVTTSETPTLTQQPESITPQAVEVVVGSE